MSDGPSVGERAPDFELPSTQGAVRLSDRLAKSAVLLVFYPGDDTPVCTRQLCDYRDNLDGFRDLGVDVVAVNPQPLGSHAKFAEKHDLPFPLCADESKRVCRDYGATGLLGMTKRALFLIDRSGVVRYRKVDLPIFRRTADELEGVIRELELEPGEGATST